MKIKLFSVCALVLLACGLVACSGSGGNGDQAGTTVLPASSGSAGNGTSPTTSVTITSTVTSPITLTVTTTVQPIQGMWLWKTQDALASAAAQTQLLNIAQAAGVTDVYMYMDANILTNATQTAALSSLLTNKLTPNHIKLWALDGCRCYFNDRNGAVALYKNVDAMIAFNAKMPTEARFAGFMLDLEPQDDSSGDRNSFHNEIADSALSTLTGGVWLTSQSADREALMQNWVDMFRTVNVKLKAAQLRTAGSMVFWIDGYLGGPVQVTYADAQGVLVRKPVAQHLMHFIDDYVVMTYNVDPSNAASRAEAAAKYADTLPPAERPRISASMETHDLKYPNTISYANAADDKKFKSVVLLDREMIKAKLAAYTAFGGVSLHDYEGWVLLPD
jgi:hypothetical protein